jgi:tRNA (cmo5U34)-methyltransferase
LSRRDHVYREPKGQIVDFAFDEAVADVFPDMIRRSVPGYETVIPITGMLAAGHLEQMPEERRLAYDLGCSLGATTAAILDQLGQLDQRPARIVAVDNAPAMIARAADAICDPRVRFEVADVTRMDFEPAGVVLLNFVLQFIDPAQRVPLLKRIRDALAPDGMLIVSEKLRFDDPGTQALFERAHLDYKRANGYSELEISQKRSALEKVMIVDTEAEHRSRFAAAGFATTSKWFQCLNWVSYLVVP